MFSAIREAICHLVCRDRRPPSFLWETLTLVAALQPDAAPSASSGVGDGIEDPELAGLPEDSQFHPLQVCHRHSSVRGLFPQLQNELTTAPCPSTAWRARGDRQGNASTDLGAEQVPRSTSRSLFGASAHLR